jgi:hypothetical protein
LVRQKHFQGNGAAGFQLTRAVNDTHSAAGDFFKQFVAWNAHQRAAACIGSRGGRFVIV